MRRLAIIVGVSLCCSCSEQNSILLTVGGDMTPGIDVDLLDVDAWSGGALVWSGTATLTTETPMPTAITISAPFSGSEVLDITVVAKRAGEVVIEVGRQAAVLKGKQVDVSICLWRRCIGSELPECGTGSCDTGAPGGDGDSDLDVETDADAAADGDVGAEDAGYPALSLCGVAVSSDPVCDLNGDGVPDNAFSDFSAVLRGIMGTYLNDVLTGSCAREHNRCDFVVINTREVEDGATPADPSFQCSVLTARDCEFDASDNDQPGEELQALPDYFEGTAGLPINDHECSVVDGALEARGDGITFFIGSARDSLRLFSTTLTATVTAGMQSAENGRACGYFEARQLATVPIAVLGLSFLDLIVAGGDAAGLPGVPGKQPDLDVDGDGLETLSVDADGRVVECLDGDRTPLPAVDGVPCTQRAEVADGFSFVLEFEAVGAELLMPRDGRGPCVE